MFELLGVLLPYAVGIKFINNRQYILESTKYSWIFHLFFLLLVFSVCFLNPILGAPYKSYALLICNAVLTLYYLWNRKKIYILIFLLGIYSNHLTIVLNNGYMPVSKEAVRRMRGKLFSTEPDGQLIINSVHRYKYIDDETIAPYLGDVIYFTYSGLGVTSIGDWMGPLSYIVFLMTNFRKKDEVSGS